MSFQELQYFLVNVKTGELYGAFHAGEAWHWLLHGTGTPRIQAEQEGWTLFARDISHGTLQIASGDPDPYVHPYVHPYVTTDAPVKP